MRRREIDPNWANYGPSRTRPFSKTVSLAVLSASTQFIKR